MLNILGSIYGKATNLRNTLYEKGVFRTHRLTVPVISIGNITAGGTGKTPLVAFTAEALAGSGNKVCILSRGYGRKNENELVTVSDGAEIKTTVEKAGDEPFELAKRLLGKASVVCDANRVRGGRFAIEEFDATVIVLDDAFQHRRIARDLNIVVIDATAPFGGGKMLPAGRLREPLQNLSRADVFVVSRSDLSDAANGLSDELREFNSSAPVFFARTETAGLRTLEEFNALRPSSSANVSGIPLFVFSGIGNPTNFLDQIEREGFNIAGHLWLKDHAAYSGSELTAVNAESKAAEAEALLTTAKDAVKLSQADLALPCYVLESRLIIDDEPAFRELLQKTVNK
jgi:tetraacyldisaccharide 4'-kinase